MRSWDVVAIPAWQQRNLICVRNAKPKVASKLKESPLKLYSWTAPSKCFIDKLLGSRLGLNANLIKITTTQEEDAEWLYPTGPSEYIDAKLVLVGIVRWDEDRLI